MYVDSYNQPVLPDVGSISVSPGLIKPSLSASSTILTPILSLIDPPALKNSHFPTVCVCVGGGGVKLGGLVYRPDQDIVLKVCSTVPQPPHDSYRIPDLQRDC